MITRKELARRKALGAQRAEVAYLIVHQMKKRGFNMTTLARKTGLSLNSISATINGIKHSPRALDGILSIGVDPALLYDPRSPFTQQAD